MPGPIATIQKAVADEWGITVQELTGRCRRPKFSQPRALAMALARELTSASYPQIGRYFDGRHHTTILHNVQRWHNLVDAFPEYLDKRQAVLRRLGLE